MPAPPEIPPQNAVTPQMFGAVGDGKHDDYPAFAAMVEHLRRLPGGAQRVASIPHTDKFYSLSAEVLFDVSDLTVYLWGNIGLGSGRVQSALLFASSRADQPATSLENVTIIGNGSYIDGNGSKMPGGWRAGDRDDAAIFCNYISNLKIGNVCCQNGYTNSLTIRQCQGFVVTGCEFKTSRFSNGASASTNWRRFSPGLRATFGHGMIEKCTAHHNGAVGMTAFDCAGVTFRECISHSNASSGFSYERQSNGLADFGGLFSNCRAYENGDHGIYIDQSGITVDKGCETYRNKYAGSDPDNLHGSGVLASRCVSVKIDGKHHDNGKCGIAIFNGDSTPISMTISGEIRANAFHGVLARGALSLNMLPGTVLEGNGMAEMGGGVGKGLFVDNGGSGYNQSAGECTVSGVRFANNGGGAVDINWVGRVVLENLSGTENCRLLPARVGIAVRVRNAIIAELNNNEMRDNSGKQGFAYVIAPDGDRVGYFYTKSNRGDAATALLVNHADSTTSSP